MAQRIKFINRKRELDQIETLIAADTRQVACIVGQGGIGKTRLLQEISVRFTQPNVQIIDTLDFDDRTLRSELSLMRAITEKLGPLQFQTYFTVLSDYRKTQRAGVSGGTLARLRDDVYDEFFKNFNQLTKKRRIVLQFDTTEKLAPGEAAEKEISDFLVRFVSRAQNTVFIFAGRPVEGEEASSYIYNCLAPILKENLILLTLEPFDEDAGAIYLKAKEKQLSMNIRPDLTKKILWLAAGRPIIIDLAAEWLARDIPLDWLVSDKTKLKTLSLADQTKRKIEFEKELVGGLRRIRGPMDQLFLLMSRVYPVNLEEITELMDVSPEEAEHIFDRATGYSFIKVISGNALTLHDEMRRMIKVYVWNEADPDHSRRRRDSQRAANYLEKKIVEKRSRIKQLEDTDKTEVDVRMDAFNARENLERELRDMEEQLLFHACQIEPEYGLRVFRKLFDRATFDYRFEERQQFINQIRNYIQRPEPAQEYYMDISQVKVWLDAGRYKKAEALATRVLRSLPDQNPQKIDALIQRGNAVIRQAKIERAIKDFEEALCISQLNNLIKEEIKARVALGWAYRQKGDQQSAQTEYEQARRQSIIQGDERQTGTILNNLSYLNALLGHERVAREQCEEAIEMRKRVGTERELASSYSTMGTILDYFGLYESAIQYYSQALDIFSSQNDIDWQCRVYGDRANMYLVTGNLPKAEEDFKRATSGTVPPYLAIQNLRLEASLAEAKKLFSKADQLYSKCYTLARKQGTQFHEHGSFVKRVEIAWELEQYQKWREFLDEFNECYQQKDESKEDMELGSPQWKGAFLKWLADLTICDNEYDRAVQFYLDGLPLIARHEFVVQYSIGRQLRQTDQRLQKALVKGILSLIDVNRLGETMYDFWRDQMKDYYLEALLIFGKWQKQREIS